ncbi:L-aspartate oxidase [Candidatus Methylobacter oryzae]|uniref:L-aspartate oxidase n=1 Tax=Candidatus Methylobacter oryzae TaxID=2497749 RepID=A0ABY3CGG0_9GAMM|nr:L-aspartate oxidase [Candidatus Methylobacter oryzae]TRX02925.1 L-aspartate oxidase [Candidatus Methylobacter oryzae]
MPNPQNYDVLIIGSGGAGLSLALKLADHSMRIAVLSKFALTAGSTYYAQGGISAVFGADDSIESHIEDTLDAGAGLCDPEIVRLTVTHGKSSIDWLREQGVVFTEEQTESGEIKLHLNKEGGHSHRRIVHTADATGKAVSLSLIERAQEHANIELFEHHNVVELITSPKHAKESEKRIVGAYVLDSKVQQVKTMAARVVVLATGGASKAYLYSTNPQSSTGDGIALAWRAGCRVSNMEFMQFHPTCLYHPQAQSFLISEAVRGEGGKLILPDGSSFMQHFDPREELAPRDIVARAIDHEMKKRGIDCVYLDISHKSEQFIREHFPTIYQQCLEFDIDITKQPIPVVPAAHYTCGGVLTDSYARTDITNLYAIGEVACTGLHGANRMASNSLLECLVFAERASEDILQKIAGILPPPPIPDWDESKVSDSDEEVVVSHNWDELRRFMWDYVGIVRTDKRLSRAMNRVELLKKEIAEYYGNFRVTSDLLELRNLVIAAELIIRCAQQRKESRGLHYTLDYPETDNGRPAQNTVLTPYQAGRS